MLFRTVLMSTLLWAACSALGLSSARAQYCESNAECEAGLVCRFRKEIHCGGYCGDGGRGSSGVGGGGQAGAEAGRAGFAGFGCDPGPRTCEALTYGYCERPTCTSARDCQPGLTCEEQFVYECADPCPGSQSCPVDGDYSEANCFEVRRAKCSPPEGRTCREDAECGAGFECVGYWERCSCNGGAGAGGVGGGAVDEQGAAGAQCSCELLGSCQIRELPCGATAECPSSFSCVPNPCAGCGGTAGGGPIPDCDPDPRKAPMVCRPPAYYGYTGCPYDPNDTGIAGASGGFAAGVGGGEPYNTGAGGASPGSGSSGYGGQASNPDHGASAGAGGLSTGAGGSRAGGAGARPSSEGGRGGHGEVPRWRRFGCSTAPTGAGDAFCSLALIALAALSLRRRRRRS